MIGIYKITNKINNKKYIGQSINIEARWKEHLANIHSDKQNLIYKAMRKYGVENFIFEVIEICNEDDLDKKEIFWIKHYDSYNNGYNMTLGGQEGRKYDYKFLISQYQKYKTVEKTAEKCGCHAHTVSRALKAHEITPHTKALGVSRKIRQIDPVSLTTINIYNSLTEASKALGKNNTTAISHALSGKTKSAYGFIWKDFNEDIEVLKQVDTKIKNMHGKEKLQQLDKDTGEILNEFNSVKEALIFLGKDSSNSGIYKVCKGIRNTAYGYKWRFIEVKE